MVELDLPTTDLGTVNIRNGQSIVRSPEPVGCKLRSQFTICDRRFARLLPRGQAFLSYGCPARFLLRASCLLLLLVLTACASQPLTVTREPVTLRLVVADSCRPLVGELVAAYEDTHPWVEIQVEVFNSSLAEQMLRTGEADLALLSWLQDAADGPSLWSQPFTRDGVAVVVHPATPFTETGLAHLQEIFRGRVQEWGGMVLTVVSREEGSGARDAFENVILGKYDVTFNAVVMPSSEAVLEYVARTPGAVGYVSTLWLSESTADGVRVPPVEGIRPTPGDVAGARYPITRPLFLAAVGEPAGEAREFAQWVLGSEGQVLVARSANW